jgi:histidyl-tRNA synthetase
VTGPDQVKDIRSGEQVDADPASWSPPAADLWPRVVPGNA